MSRPRKALFFHSDLYRQDFYFLYRWSPQQVDKLLGPNYADRGGFADLIGDNVYMWIAEGEGYGALVHECVHAANFVLGSRGVAVSAKDDEAQAYLVQWIFDKCCLKFKPLIK